MTSSAPSGAAHRQYRHGVALGLGCATVYATGPTMIRAALLDGMGSWTLLVVRMLIGVVLLAALTLALERGVRRRWPRRPSLEALAVGAVGYGMQLALFTVALQRANAALVVVLFSSFPVFVVIVTTVFGGERLTRTRLLCVALGVGGVAVVALAAGDAHGDADPLGLLAAVGSGMACAVMVLGGDRLGRDVPPLRLTMLMTAGAAIAFLVAAPIVGVGLPQTGKAWLLVIGIAVGPGVIGTVTMLGAVERVGPSLTSILMTFEPVVGVAIAWVALGEGLTAPQFVGAVLIVGAIVIAQREGPPREPPIPV